MQDHEFEDQVHQKMEELSLSPSGAVWNNVEDQLHKKERKRRIFWFSFLFAVILSAGYFSVHHYSLSERTILISNNNKAAHISDNGQNINKSVPGKNISKINAKAAEKALIPMPEKTNKEIDAGNAIKNHLLPLPGLEVHAAGSALVSENVKKYSLPLGSKHLSGEKTRKAAPAQLSNKYQVYRNSGRVAKSEFMSEKNDMPKVLKERIPSPDLTVNQASEISIKEPLPALITAIDPVKKFFQTGITVAGYTAASSHAIKIPKKRNLVWGMSFQAGKTAISAGKINSFFAGTMADNYAYASLPVRSNSGGNITAPIGKPSPLHAGLGLSAGFFIRKQFSRRLALSSGINYTLFTTSVKTGEKVDSTVRFSFSADKANEFFRSGNGYQYINRYHFIELPVLLQVQINNGAKTPLIWEAGVSLSQLLASNALHYNDSIPGYYKNNHLFNKTQLSLVTGLHLQLFSGSSNPVRVGPQLQYGITHLVPEAVNKNNHLLQYGFKISSVIK